MPVRVIQLFVLKDVPTHRVLTKIDMRQKRDTAVKNRNVAVATGAKCKC